MAKKINKKHDFKHLEKTYKISAVLEGEKGEQVGGRTKAPQEDKILIDLKRTMLLSILIITILSLLGYIVYKTDVLTGVLENFSLKY